MPPPGPAVLRHQRQAHPGSANAVEGELAKGPGLVGVWLTEVRACYRRTGTNGAARESERPWHKEEELALNLTSRNRKVEMSRKVNVLCLTTYSWNLVNI